MWRLEAHARGIELASGLILYMYSLQVFVIIFLCLNFGYVLVVCEGGQVFAGGTVAVHGKDE